MKPADVALVQTMIDNSIYRTARTSSHEHHWNYSIVYRWDPPNSFGNADARGHLVPILWQRKCSDYHAQDVGWCTKKEWAGSQSQPSWWPE